MIHVKKHLHPDQGLQGLGGLSADGGAALVLRRQFKKPVLRFSMGRALWHLTEDHSAERFLLTTSHTDRQRSERAFAAELLAPAQGVLQFVPTGGGIVTAEDVEDIAGHFSVSPLVIRHQVENQLALQVA
jgi:Zn-dependent peptidase ImmA (M78 family)